MVHRQDVALPPNGRRGADQEYCCPRGFLLDGSQARHTVRECAREDNKGHLQLARTGEGALPWHVRPCELSRRVHWRMAPVLLEFFASGRERDPAHQEHGAEHLYGQALRIGRGQEVVDECGGPLRPSGGFASQCLCAPRGGRYWHHPHAVDAALRCAERQRRAHDGAEEVAPSLVCTFCRGVRPVPGGVSSRAGGCEVTLRGETFPLLFHVKGRCFVWAWASDLGHAQFSFNLAGGNFRGALPGACMRAAANGERVRSRIDGAQGY
mmetsp:Transcript_56071/g.149598  ORF Transcript_56071/g.149598 Transcript_56071/m.149598 type:complete len:267 (+) Transcript_56071:1361-2161(+)